MISSSGETGGGPIQMSILSNKLKKHFDFYFAIPKSKDLLKLLNKANHFDIFFNALYHLSIIKIKTLYAGEQI